jgi:quercetin 2,3-dioxygenase
MPATAATAVQRSRRVERIVRGQPTADGDGVKLTRVLTQPLQHRLDPFLMLDAFGSDAASDYVGGFPDHPHRGFETVTLMLEGRMRHRDSVGNVGLLEPGSVQWMTAGRGIVHSEMPEQSEGRMAGFQLWVNLAARDKLCPPAYRDVSPSDVPEVALAGSGRVRVIAGAFGGIQGAVSRPTTEPLVLDITLPAAAMLDVPLPATHNAFVYVHGGGTLVVGGGGGGGGAGAGAAGSADADTDIGAAPIRVDSDRMAILANDAAADGVRLSATSGAPVRVLLVAGKPLGEPIAQYGPFVMNTTDELRQAVADFQQGALAMPAGRI